MLNLSNILTKKSGDKSLSLDTTGLGPPRKENLLQTRLYSSLGTSEPIPATQEAKRKSEDIWEGLLTVFRPRK